MMGVNQRATNIQKATMIDVNPVLPPSRMPVADSAPANTFMIMPHNTQKQADLFKTPLLLLPFASKS